MTAAPLDPGRANERTELAWQRTALGLLLGSALMLRFSFSHDSPAAVFCSMLAGLLAGWVFTESLCRYAHSAEIRKRPRAKGGRAAATLTLATVALALAGFGLLIQ